MAPLSASPRGLWAGGDASRAHRRTQSLFLFFAAFFLSLHSISRSSTLCPLPISTLKSSFCPPRPSLLSPFSLSSAPLYSLVSSFSLPVPCSRLCRLLSLPGDGIMKNAPIDRAPQLRLAEMGHDRPRSILIPSYNVSTNESISAKFSIFQKPTRETGISSFVKILLSISSAI